MPDLSTRDARRIELAASVDSPLREMKSLSWLSGPSEVNWRAMNRETVRGRSM